MAEGLQAWSKAQSMVVANPPKARSMAGAVDGGGMSAWVDSEMTVTRDEEDLADDSAQLAVPSSPSPMSASSNEIAMNPDILAGMLPHVAEDVL